MSWLDHIIISLIVLGLFWLIVIVLVKFFSMMRDVDD